MTAPAINLASNNWLSKKLANISELTSVSLSSYCMAADRSSRCGLEWHPAPTCCERRGSCLGLCYYVQEEVHPSHMEQCRNHLILLPAVSAVSGAICRTYSSCNYCGVRVNVTSTMSTRGSSSHICLLQDTYDCVWVQVDVFTTKKPIIRNVCPHSDICLKNSLHRVCPNHLQLLSVYTVRHPPGSLHQRNTR